MGPRILVHPSSIVAVSAALHLSDADVAAYVDRTLPAGARARVERHLVECDACREEVTACARLVTAAPSRIPTRSRWVVMVPVAAAVLAAVLLRRPDGNDRLAPALERGATANASRIVQIAPAPGALVDANAMRLVWRPVERSAGYHVVVKDAAGAALWRADVTDTSVALPRGIALRAGESYVWRVDGQRTDGTSVTSPEIVFRIARE
jgi:anti-sigma factor RsiW